ncbi:hypothetical protein DFS34DRAFT_493622 [Phlyctochytrium arcticum]|nr:hypothetical protein DFS34DRAFT_493622 [Phlyctochytrium arcticum]
MYSFFANTLGGGATAAPPAPISTRPTTSGHQINNNNTHNNDNDDSESVLGPVQTSLRSSRTSTGSDRTRQQSSGAPRSVDRAFVEVEEDAAIDQEDSDSDSDSSYEYSSTSHSSRSSESGSEVSLSSSYSDGAGTNATASESDEETFLSAQDISESLQELIQQSLEQGTEFQVPRPPARPYLVGMPPLYTREMIGHDLSDDLDADLSESESVHVQKKKEVVSDLKTSHPQRDSLRHDVLRARLAELVLTLEFASSYGAKAHTLSAASLHAISKTNHHLAPSVPADFPGPSNLPPLTRALYVRLLRNLPLIAGHGPKYLQGIDKFVENEFLTVVGTWMRATKFDVLSFMIHYVTLFSHLKNEAWFGHDGQVVDVPDTYTPPAMPPSSRYTDLTSFHRASLPCGGTFRLGKRAVDESLNDSQDMAKIISLRELKAREFNNAWRNVMRAGCSLCRDAHGQHSELMSSSNQPGIFTKDDEWAAAFWTVAASTPDLDQLPGASKEFFYALTNALAHTIDNILDDDDWRQKFASIWRRLPVTIMLTSLRLINPIPFIERVIKLFCWKPPGMYSLLQKIGTMICAIDKTKSQLRDLSVLIHPTKRAAIDRAVDTAFNEWVNQPVMGVSSQDSPAVVEKFLRASGERCLCPGKEIAETDLAYTKLSIRKREKEDLVTLLGSPTFTAFIRHISHVFPPLLSEIWTCIDFASLMSKLVECITNILEALAAYDKAPPGTDREVLYRQVVGNVYKALLPFIKAAWPLIHAVAKKPESGPAGLRPLINHLFRDMIEPPTSPTDALPILDLGKDASNMLKRLSEDERDQLWNEVDEVVRHLEGASDPRQWPVGEVLEGKAVGIYWGDVVGEFAGRPDDDDDDEDEDVTSQTPPPAYSAATTTVPPPVSVVVVEEEYGILDVD